MGSQLNIIRVRTPLQAGSGHASIGVDNPIQRDIVTGRPKVESTTLKGCFRRSLEINKANDYFGTLDRGGQLAISDANILLYPVKEAGGFYVYITCPDILQQFNSLVNTMFTINLWSRDTLNRMHHLTPGTCLVGTAQTEIKHEEVEVYVGVHKFHGFHYNGLNVIRSIALDELDQQKIVVLSNEDFHFILQNNSEITYRNRIDDETGTTQDGGLFTEEYLPARSILYFSIASTHAANERIPVELSGEMQVGGKETLGKGKVNICKVNEQSIKSQEEHKLELCYNSEDLISDTNLSLNMKIYHSMMNYMMTIKEKHRKKTLEDLTSHIKRLPMLIRKNGALQTILYIESRQNSENTHTSKETWAQALDVLKECFYLLDMCTESKKLSSYFIQASKDHTKYRCLNERFLHIATVYKRIVCSFTSEDFVEE